MYLIDKKYELLNVEDSIEEYKLYTAKNVRTGEKVYVKLIAKSEIIRDEFLVNLIDEMTVFSDLNSPYILKTLDLGVEKINGVIYFYIASEYYEGIELSKLIKDKKIELDYVIKIFIQVLKSLEAANSIQAYHGLLTPDCIIVDEYYNVKVSGFGIVRANNSTHPRIAGTMDYMCPHQICVNYTDKDSDYFSFGEILYEVYFEEKAFGAVDSEYELLKNIDRGINWKDQKYKEENQEIISILSRLLDRDKEIENYQELIIELSSIMYERATEEDDLREEVSELIQEKKNREKSNLIRNIILALFIIMLIVTMVLAYF